MTVDAALPIATYVVAGAGPYPVPWPYKAGSLRVGVVIGGIVEWQAWPIWSDDQVEWTNQVADQPTGGNIWLQTTAAVDYGGLTLQIERRSVAAQDWGGHPGFRERGIEAALDQLTMLVQEDRAAHDQMIRIAGAEDMAPLVMTEGDTLIWDGEKLIAAPAATGGGSATPGGQAATLFRQADYMHADDLARIRAGIVTGQDVTRVTNGLRALHQAALTYMFSADGAVAVVQYEAGTSAVNRRLMSDTFNNLLWSTTGRNNSKMMFTATGPVIFRLSGWLDGASAVRTDGIYGEMGLAHAVPNAVWEWAQPTGRGYLTYLDLQATIIGQNNYLTDPIGWRFYRINSCKHTGVLEAISLYNVGFNFESCFNSSFDRIQSFTGWQPTEYGVAPFVDNALRYNNSGAQVQIISSTTGLPVSFFQDHHVGKRISLCRQGSGQIEVDEDEVGARGPRWFTIASVDTVDRSKCTLTEVPPYNGGGTGQMVTANCRFSFDAIAASSTAGSNIITLSATIPYSMVGRTVTIVGAGYQGENAKMRGDNLISIVTAHTGNQLTLAHAAARTRTTAPIVVAAAVHLGTLGCDIPHANYRKNDDFHIRRLWVEVSSYGVVPLNIQDCTWVTIGDGSKLHGATQSSNNWAGNFANIVGSMCRARITAKFTHSLHSPRFGKFIFAGNSVNMVLQGTLSSWLADSHTAQYYLDPDMSGESDFAIYDGMINDNSAFPAASAFQVMARGISDWNPQLPFIRSIGSALNPLGANAIWPPANLGPVISPALGSTRAAAVSAIAQGMWTPRDGAIYLIGGSLYVGKTGATSITDLPGLEATVSPDVAAINASGAGVPNVQALVTTTADGIAATSSGQYFAVATGSQTDLYRNATGVAELIRLSIEQIQDVMPAAAPSAPALVTSAQSLKKYGVPLRKVLGRSYSSGNNCAGILNSVLPQIAAAAYTVRNVDPIEMSFQAQLSLISGLDIRWGPAVLWRDWTGAGNSIGAMFGQANWSTGYIENVTWSGGIIRYRNSSIRGQVFNWDINRARFDGVKIYDYRGGRAWACGGDDVIVSRCEAYTGDTTTGDGAYRPLFGTRMLFVNCIGDCYDDVFQFVPATGSGLPAYRKDRSITYSQYIGCEGVSRKGRLFIGAVIDQPDETVVNSASKLQHIDFIGIKGRAPGGFVIACNASDGTVTRQLDNIGISRCSIEATSDVTFSGNVASAIYGTPGLPNVLGRITIDGLSIDGSPKKYGLDVFNADGAQLVLSGLGVTGQTTALRIRSEVSLDLQNGAYSVTPDGDVDRQPIVITSTAGASKVKVDGPVLRGVPSNYAGLAINSAATVVDVRSMRVEVAAGATNTRAMSGVTGATAYYLPDQLSGTYDLMNFGSITAINRSAPPAATIERIASATSRSVALNDLKDITVVDGISGPRTWTLNGGGAVAGIARTIMRTDGSANVLTIAASGGGTLATLTAAADWVEIAWDGAALVVTERGGAGGGGGSTSWGAILGTLSAQTDLQAALDAKQSLSDRNAANGYAGLDASGKVAAAQLPSFVDDVIEAANFAGLPGTGETGKIYVTLDTNKTFRWSGSAYVEISPSPGSTDAVPEGATNLYFSSGRVRTSALNGFSVAASRAAIIATDTVLGAFNKAQKYFNDLAAVAFSGAWADLGGTPTTLSGYGITDRARPQNIPASGEAILLSAGVAGTALSTTVGTAGRIDLFPFTTPVTIAATAFQVNVTTGGASSVGRVLIYAADSSGNPAGLLFASADIEISTTGIKTSTLGYTLQAGVLYWIGWQFSNASSPAVSATPTAMTFDINAGGPSTTAKKALRRVVTYASGPPDPWGYTSSEVNSAVPAAIWAKV